jgi:MFS family permease
MQRLAARLGIHYGWVVAATTFLTMLVTAGAMGAPGVLIEPLKYEFGWTSTQISTAFAVRLALFGLMGPFSAAFMNYFGIRRVVAGALALIAAGILASMAMTSLWQLMLLWGVVVGLGTGMTAAVLGATVAGRWFERRRGLVMGMLAASTATGQLVFLPALARLTAHWGWRTALAFVLAMLLLGVLAVLALMRDWPADVGLAPYGARQLRPAAPRPTDIRAMLAVPVKVLREVRGNRLFWLLFGSFFVCGASRRISSRCAATTALPRLRPPACSPPSASSISSAPSVRAGCRIAMTAAGCCSGTTGCAACRCCTCRSRISARRSWVSSQCSTGWTGWRLCRRP